MPPIDPSYQQSPDGHDSVLSEADIEDRFIEKLRKLKYSHRPDIHTLDALETNFREKFERLNAVTLSDSEFARLLDLITTPDVYKSAEILRGINSFERDNGTPLNFTLVNIKDWCKNDYEIVSQLRINTRSSFHRYDVILLINGIPCTQIELKTLQISPRRAMQQIVDYKADPGNGYTNTLLASDYADKVIVTTIHKLGLALDETSKRNLGRKERKQQTYKEMLAPLANKRLAIIFDECHRSQFGDNHKAIKDFFPNSQLFGFTGTPIFEENATVRQIDGEEASYKTTEDIFQQELHKYTITHAIEDKNVLKFHVDYFKPEVEKGKPTPKPGEPISKIAVIEAILERHDQTTAHRKFNALFATASINEAIAYHALFAEVQAKKLAADPDYRPLNIACVFSPPAEGNPDVKQLQEDLPQEKADNKEKPDKKKEALKAILQDYNDRFGTNHSLIDFDAYYQDVQDRIKAQRFPTADLRKATPRAKAHKIDITIVVDMLLTGFDSKYLNTLYVDKKLKYHGLIQAFSRTNRILNDSKPHGHILDFRQQQDAVDEAIQLFSGEKADQSKEIWLVDPAPTVIEKLDAAVHQLKDFMQSQGLSCAPEDVHQLKGDAARAQFIKSFKEVQRLKTQLDQYTNLEPEQKAAIEQTLPTDAHRAFKSAYIETARKLKRERETGGPGGTSDEVNELDFEFVLFASATIDYDYILELVAKADGIAPAKQKMTREQLVALIASDAQFADQRDLLEKYIRQLDLGQGRSKEEILKGYETFKTAEESRELQSIAQTHGLAPDALSDFVEAILHRHVFDGERLTDLMAPLELGWKARSQAERALMKDLVPLLKQRADGQEISGLSGYEH